MHQYMHVLYPLYIIQELKIKNLRQITIKKQIHGTQCCF